MLHGYCVFCKRLAQPWPSNDASPSRRGGWKSAQRFAPQLLHLARTREGWMASTPGLLCTRVWTIRPLLVNTLCTAGLHHRQQKTDARRAFPLSLSSTGQQSDETLHVQWFGRLVENASGMSRMLCALDASFSSAYSFFVLAFNGCSRAAWSTEEAISQSLRACDLMSRKCSGHYELVPRADDM